MRVMAESSLPFLLTLEQHRVIDILCFGSAPKPSVQTRTILAVKLHISYCKNARSRFLISREVKVMAMTGSGPQQNFMMSVSPLVVAKAHTTGDEEPLLSASALYSLLRTVEPLGFACACRGDTVGDLTVLLPR